MATFIEETLKQNASGNHDYEDVIVQGQIIEAKGLIQEAIKANKNSVTWYYRYDSYESFISRIDTIYPGPYADSFAGYKTDANLTAGEYNSYGGTCDHLYNLVFDHKGGGPKIPTSFNYEYAKSQIEKELYSLGCKQVEVYIGPKTITVSKPVGKPNFLTGKYKYQDVTVNVVKWMISISW